MDPAAPHRSLAPGLTATLRGFFYGAAAVGLGAALAVTNEARRFGSWIEGGAGTAGRLVDAREVSEGLVGLFGLCSLVLAVLTLMWWYQAYSAVARTGVIGRSWSPGWAIGGWFIPLGNLVIPKLVLDEIDRISSAAEEGVAEWRARPTSRTTGWWWGGFVVASILIAVGTSITTEQTQQGLPSVDLYRRGLWLTSAGLAVDAGAALAAAASLRVLGGRLQKR